jgi:uncharacterized protein (DUF1800 family)
MTFTAEIAAMRWGYGLPLPHAAPLDAEAMLDLLAGPDLAGATHAVPQMAEIVPLLDALRLKKKPAKTDPALHDEVIAVEATLSAAMFGGIATTFARAIDSPDGLRERLVQFWADHFTTTTRGPYFALFPLAQVEDAIRPNLTGRFADLLRAAILHPAMITYLDQNRSSGPNSALGSKRGKGLNENLARELLELHTLGSGAGYKQADVYQTAELLTGLSFDLADGKGGHFDTRRVEPGPEWVLGQKYDGEGMVPIHALLDDLAARPETARHIARKLVVHFITDSPKQGDVASVEQAFNDSGGDLMTVYRTLLGLMPCTSGDALKIRQPYDFMVASFRALGTTGADLTALDRQTQRRVLVLPMAAMGQPFKSARGPDGAAEEAEAWITPLGLAARLNWVISLQRGQQALVTPIADPATMARQALGTRASPELLAAVAEVTDRAEAVALALISPAFNRR